MATVDLTAVYLNAADDLSDVMAFEYAGDALSVNTAARVEVRQLMSRRRLFRRGTATAETFDVTFKHCTAEQVAWLVEHVGALVCVRDHVGGKFYGVFAEVPREVDTRYPNHRDAGTPKAARSDVKLTIEQITHFEAA